MSTSMITSYAFAGKQVTIYLGIPIFICGVIGGILNTIVFSSLQTFRESSCAFYLTIMSVVNLGQLLLVLLARLMTTIFNRDGTESSLFFCKFRIYFGTVCATISWTCFCLAAIDQCCSTNYRVRFRQFCNIKLAQRLVIIFIIIWILHAIPFLILYGHIVSSNTGAITCTMTNFIYIQYRTYVLILILYGILPVSISILFGSMAYFNVQQLSHYALPIVRRELDKQLTVMVLTQIIVTCSTSLTFTIVNALQLNPNLNSDPLNVAKMQLALSVTLIMSYLHFASPFYIYICASKRFRRQLIYVLFKIHLNRCGQQPRINNNQVVPQL